MATTLVSGLTVFSDASGHGNQSHLVYAPVQQRWWLFVIKTKTATVVSTYVSSSNDLTTATWAASTDSNALTQALSTNDQRNLGVAVIPNAINANDVVHVDVSSCAGATSGAAQRVAHARAKFTGASSITWEAWNEVVTTSAGVVPRLLKGNAVGVSSTGVIHDCQLTVNASGSNNNGDPLARVSTNADSGSTWTNGFGSLVTPDDGMGFICNSYAFAPLAAAAMLLVYENASVSDTTSGGLKSSKYTSGTTWPANTGTVDVGIGTSTQDDNDWCLCAVDATHIYAFRRDSNTAILCRRHDGNITWSTPVSTVPTFSGVGSGVVKAGAGLFAATDGANLWLFVMDTTTNNGIYYVKGSTASGTISFGSWTLLEAAGSTARNFISGNPVVSNNQIGVIYTAVNGANFDIVASALALVTPPPPSFRLGAFDSLMSRAAWFDLSRTAAGEFAPEFITVPSVDVQKAEGADTSVFAAGATVGGASAITETADTLASAAAVTIVSAALPTETADTSAFAATVALISTFTKTETADTLDNSGIVAATIIGISALTPESADTSVSAGAVALVASLSKTETADTLAAAGAVALAADLSKAEGSDTSAFAATLALVAAAADTETADTSTSAGLVSVRADSANTTADDTFAGAAAVVVGNSLADTELADVLDATVTTLGGLVIDAGPTETADTAASTAGVTAAASLAQTEGADVLDATVTTLSGLIFDAAIVEGGDVTAFDATLPLVATSAVTEGSDTVVFSGSSVGGLVANLSVTTAGDSLVFLILAGTSHQSFQVSAFSPDTFGMAL